MLAAGRLAGLTRVRGRFYEYVKGPEMDKCRDGINTLVAEFKVLDERIAELQGKNLPSQARLELLGCSVLIS